MYFSATYDELPELLYTVTTTLVCYSGTLWRMSLWFISHNNDCDITVVDRMILTLKLLTSNKMGDQDLSCTIYLPSLVMIFPAVFILFRVLTYTHTYIQSG